MTTAHHVHGITDNDGDLIQHDDYPWLDDFPSQPLDDDRRSLDASLDLTSQHEDDLVSYRSPPFREADLPSTSANALTELEGLEAPLPVPPPRARGFGYNDDDDDSHWTREREEGHTRSPTLPSPRSSSHSRSPSSSAPSPAGNTLDSLSRTISSLKSYVPSVPSGGTLKSYVPSLKTYAEPSPPSVSRPLSFATFSAGEVEKGSARGRGRGRGGIRGDAYQREEYVDFQGDTRRGRVGRDEDLYWDQPREVALDERSRPRQEFERDYELDQDFDGYVRGKAEARERLSGENQADRELMRWAEGGDEPLLRQEEDRLLSSREEDRLPQVRRSEQGEPARKIEPDGPSSRRSEQIAPPSWRVPSRREEGQDMERRHHVRQKTVVPPQTALPSRQQTIVPGRHNALLDRQHTIVPQREEEDTPILAFTRQESGLAQAMRGVAGQASGRVGAGAADPSSARPGQTVVDLGEEDGSAQGAEERGGGGGGAKHAYAHPAREADLISWARWDLLGDKRLLILSYIPSGLQIWDCTDLGTVTEVLNLNFSGAEWKELEFDVGRVIYAALLSSDKSSSFKEDRPFLGIILESVQDPESTTFVVYSLSRHRVIVRVPVPGPGARAESFLSNEDFIVVSTTTPLPVLHILSSTTFELLSTIPYSALAPYTTPSSHSFPTSHSTLTPTQQQHYIFNNPILLGTRQGISMTPIDKPNTHHHHHHPRPHAIFALSKRLLAYACPPPSSSSSSTTTTKDHRRLSSTSTQTSASAGSSSAASSWKSMTQAQGELALKVGGSMLTGMKFLGGMAYDAALKRGGGTGEPPPPPINRLFSRSAPTKREGEEEEEEEEKRRRRYSGEPSVAAAANQVFERERKAGGYHVRVVDLASLATTGMGNHPRVVFEFQSSRSQPIADLRFSKDGCSLAVIPRDGHLIKVFQLRPAPAVLFGGGRDNVASQPGSSDLEQSRSVWHLYDLRRGRTSAVVEGVDWAQDGRWLAIGTRNRTVHVFPVNPYGGKVDVKSHLEGRVRNVLAGATIPAKTEVTPLVRLRGVRSQQVSPSSALEHHPSLIAPLAFIFLNPSDVTIPPNLLPSLPTVVDPTSSPPLSPRRAEDRSRNYQDVLLFDSADGMLSLRRLTVEQHPKEPSLPSTVVQASVSAATSISFPGMGGAGRLSTSPSSAGASASTRPSALTKMMDTPELELSAKGGVVATWNLQRRRDWGEIKRRLVDTQRMRDWGGLTENLDWLSQAEITTFSKSQHVLPRSLYLCHQFSFHTLGEDYHALIRRYQFDISGHKIEVRKEVEVNAFSSTTTEDGAGESFVEGSFSSSPRDIRRFSTSFDEPLASALGAGFNHSPQSNQAIIPMFPNGTPGSKPKSFRSSIPIRTMAGLGDGMSEGFGRIRREIQHKVRSPLLAPRSDSSVSASVPLEFDEEDEDFLGGGVGAVLDAPVPVSKQREGSSVSRGTSRDDGVSVDSSLSTSSASVNIDDDVVGTVDEDIWQGWDYQDKMAIEEAERFDDISAVGFLNAEQEVSKPIATTDGEGRKRTGRERRKH